jgi:hypothetical protein
VALSAFDDRSRPPRDDELAAALGTAWPAWQELHRAAAIRLAPLSVEWGFTSPTTGWGQRLRHDGRIVMYLIPCESHFLASFALGEKAVRGAHDAGLPAEVLAAIGGARRYAEGRGVRLEVRDGHDVEAVLRLAAVKLAN